jgi:hypothetical protein
MAPDMQEVLQRPLTLEQAREWPITFGRVSFRILVDLDDLMAPYSVNEVDQMLCRQFLEGDHPDCLDEIELWPVAVVDKKLVLEVQAEFRSWLQKHDVDSAAKADQPPAGGITAGS